MSAFCFSFLSLYVQLFFLNLMILRARALRKKSGWHSISPLHLNGRLFSFLSSIFGAHTLVGIMFPRHRVLDAGVTDLNVH